MTDAEGGRGASEHRADLPGLQNERTALAWQRTALSLLAGAAAITRLTYAELGNAVLLCAYAALMITGFLFWTSRTHYLHRDRTPAQSRPCGRNAALTTLVVVILAATELIAIAVN